MLPSRSSGYGGRQRPVSMRVLNTQIDIALGRADGDAGDGHSFDQDKRVALHQHAVGKRARIAFIGVARDIFLIRRLVEDSLPFDTGWERGTAASAEPRLGDLLDDVGPAHPECARQPRVAVDCAVVIEAHRVVQANSRERHPFLILEIGDRIDGAELKRVPAAVKEIGIEQRRHVSGRHGPVGHAAGRCLRLDQRLEPAHPARAVPYDTDIEPARGCLGRNSLRHAPGPDRQRGRVAGNIHRHRVNHRRSQSATISLKRCGVTRPYSSPSIIMAGEQAQFPRQ